MTEKARRDLILEGADRLLRHYGLQKTTMADVAREANVGVGTVYLDFPSKDALVEELSRRHYGAVIESMRFKLEDSVGAQAADRLVRVLEARAVGFLAMADAGAHACDLLHCASESVKIAQSAYLEEERAIFTEVLREGARNGEFDVTDLEATLRTLLLAYSPFAPPLIFKIDRKRFGVDMEGMHTLVLRGLLRREGAEDAPAPRPGPLQAPPRKKRSP